MNSILNQFNKLAAKDSSLITKALTSASGVGEGLVPEYLEQVITNTVIHLSPEIALVDAKNTGGAKTAEFNRKTASPAPGGAMGENATTPVTQSATARATVNLKVVRRKGKVTNFLNDASRRYIDAAAYEMQNELESHVKDFIYYMLYGNKDGVSIVNTVAEQTPNVEFDGIEKFISTNRFNKSRGGEVPTSLSELDTLIDSSNRKGGARHRRVFGMSPEMLSKFSQLLTNVRLTQGLSAGGLTQVMVDGGWRLNAYRDIPIIETTATRPTQKFLPTATIDHVASGGSLSDGTYYIQIAPLTLEGEQEASTQQSVTLNSGGSSQRIRISLDDIHKDASGNVNTFAYKIYASSTSGACVLRKIVPAYIYDAEYAPSLTSYNGVGTNYIYVGTLTAGNDVPSHMQDDVPLTATGGVRPEIVYLWDLDPIQGLGRVPYTNTAGDQYNGLVTTKPLAEIDDYIHFLVKSYACLQDSYEGTSCWLRGLRVE